MAAKVKVYKERDGGNTLELLYTGKVIEVASNGRPLKVKILTTPRYGWKRGEVVEVNEWDVVHNEESN